MNSLLKFTIIAFAFSLCITIAHAQSLPSAPIDGVDISATPEYPAPGDNVVIKVTSYNTDLNSASIVWIVDGKTVSKGTGLTSINVTAPQNGKSIAVQAAILTVENRQVQKAIAITSGDVDLIWEGAGYVPPFFKGKAMFAYQNAVKLTAMPHLIGSNGKEIDPNTLVYKWKENDKVLQDQSGFGKQSAVIESDVPQPLTIEVDVNTRDGTQNAVSSITLTPTDPSITLYENDPLYGILYNEALGDRVAMKNREISLLAVPYSFSEFAGSPPLQYTWSVNDLEEPGLSTNQSITLRTADNSEGSSNISLTIKNIGNILQGATAGTTIFFTKDTTNSTAQTATF